MEQQNEMIQQVLGDLAVLRRAIERAEGSGARYDSAACRTHLYLQGGAALLAGILLACELLSHGGLTASFLYSKIDSKFMINGLIQTAGVLMLLGAAMYAAVRIIPRTNSQSIEDYITDNFVYLKNLSIYSDLLIKFLLFCMVILSGRPDWVGPLFLLFTADYLLQGRFFTLPLKTGLILGFGCVLGALAQYYYQCPSVAIALVTFVGIALLSCLRILQLGSYNNSQADKE